MKRPTYAQLVARGEAIERERVMRFLDRHAADVRVMAENGKIGGEEFELLARRITTIGEQIGQGLHDG